MMLTLSQKDWLECIALSQEYAPKDLPQSWTKITLLPEDKLFGQQMYERRDGLLVIFTADRLHGDGKTWLHVSMSRKKRLPSYEDMKLVKELFIGKDRNAIQIFPPEKEHINIHEYCLHLWSAVEGDDLPQFGIEGTI